MITFDKYILKWSNKWKKKNLQKRYKNRNCTRAIHFSINSKVNIWFFFFLFHHLLLSFFFFWWWCRWCGYQLASKKRKFEILITLLHYIYCFIFINSLIPHWGYSWIIETKIYKINLTIFLKKIKTKNSFCYTHFVGLICKKQGNLILIISLIISLKYN